MRITADQAAEIARRAGLSLSDAVALQQLADDPDTAERIARRFADESDGRDLARAVFGPQPTDDDTDGTDDLAEVARALFDN